MRRAGALAALALVVGLAAGFAQHHETVSDKTTEEAGPGTHGNLELWKWANFALLAGALGWVIKKNAGPFFDARSREIRKQLVEAKEIRAEADRRTQQVETRLANLGTEIEALKREALAEQQVENERFRAQTAAEMAKVRAQAEQEIAAAGKQARLDLKRYSAGLALETAQRKIRARMTPGAQETLVDSFVRNLEAPSSRATGM